MLLTVCKEVLTYFFVSSVLRILGKTSTEPCLACLASAIDQLYSGVHTACQVYTNYTLAHPIFHILIGKMF